MKHVVAIKSQGDLDSRLAIHPEIATEFGLDVVKFTCVSFGSARQYVKILRDPQLAPAELYLSRNIMEALRLPDYLDYELAVYRNEITIGPYIGLLLSAEDRRLTLARLKKWLVYAREYQRLHGALVVFALDKVDRCSRLLEGYCYNPIKKSWQRGVFPYPAAIYRTVGLSAEWKNHFLSILGDKIFNSRYFNKWQMYQWFSEEPDFRPHLPVTVLYRAPKDVLAMLERFSALYIKPVFGLEGRGIVRLHTENQRIILRTRKRGENSLQTFDSAAGVAAYLRQRLRSGRYLVQQAIDLLEYQGSLIDFRCVVQKNQANLWVCRAIIGRFGVKNSIVSNISSGGRALPVEEILRRVLAKPAAAIAGMKEEMAAFALSVADRLDAYGINCGTLGLDLGLDRQGRLWLIEINNRDPDPSIALDVRDVQLYYTLKSGPLFYAKYLAGFPEAVKLDEF